MEFLKKAFSTKTATGRMVRTFVQAFGATVALLATLVALPEFTNLLRELGAPGLAAAIASFVTAASGLHSLAESLWRKLSAWADGE